MTKMTRKQFLEATNKNARTRLFDADSYEAYCCAIKAARKAAKENKPYLTESSAGGVANNYGSTTSTARWGVYTTPNGNVVQIVDRPTISGRHVGSVFSGGERAYQKWFREMPQTALNLYAECPAKAEGITAAYQKCNENPGMTLCIGLVRSLGY